MLQLSVSRILFLAFIVLTSGTISWGAPLKAGKYMVSRDTCLNGCAAGTNTAIILTKLQNDLQPKLQALDNHYTAGTDPTEVMNEIVILVNIAGSNISLFPKDMTGLLNGKGPEIINIWTEILSDLVRHFTKWNSDSNTEALGDIFAALSQKVAAAATAFQSALTGIFGGLQTLLSNILEAAKPHWEQLQEQLVGQGLNILGSVSETIDNLHGSITGGGRA